MNKNDLIAKVAESTSMSKADATRVIDCALDTITSALKEGDEVRLVGFGTFTVSTRAASEGRNPRTGEKIAIPASRQPKFKAGTELKRVVNG
ncbi:MAG: HU family DNA-binding protein [Alphaproteobacteria bacterium]|nr:HU family DNA-binding protein [Alphaproteobacteria bacterium]